MFALRRQKEENPKTYPELKDRIHEGVYNRWKSAYIEKMDSYSAMSDTIEYFVITPLGDSKTHVVRIVRNIQEQRRYTADYSEDSRILHRPVSGVTASDVINTYPLSEHERKWAGPRDNFGLRRVGTLDDFVEEMKK